MTASLRGRKLAQGIFQLERVTYTILDLPTDLGSGRCNTTTGDLQHTGTTQHADSLHTFIQFSMGYYLCTSEDCCVSMERMASTQQTPVRHPCPHPVPERGKYSPAASPTLLVHRIVQRYRSDSRRCDHHNPQWKTIGSMNDQYESASLMFAKVGDPASSKAMPITS